MGAPERAALTDAALYYRSQLAASWVPEYLRGRGLGSAVRFRWLTGHAPGEWTATSDHLRAQGQLTVRA